MSGIWGSGLRGSGLKAPQTGVVHTGLQLNTWASVMSPLTEILEARGQNHGVLCCNWVASVSCFAFNSVASCSLRWSHKVWAHGTFGGMGSSWSSGCPWLFKLSRDSCVHTSSDIPYNLFPRLSCLYEIPICASRIFFLRWKFILAKMCSPSEEGLSGSV